MWPPSCCSGGTGRIRSQLQEKYPDGLSSKLLWAGSLAAVSQGATTQTGLTNLDSDVTGVGTATPGIGQQNVLGLQITMDDALAVQQLHSTSDLLQEQPDCIFTQGAHGCKENRLRGPSSSATPEGPPADSANPFCKPLGTLQKKLVLAYFNPKVHLPPFQTSLKDPTHSNPHRWLTALCTSWFLLLGLSTSLSCQSLDLVSTSGDLAHSSF